VRRRVDYLGDGVIVAAAPDRRLVLEESRFDDWLQTQGYQFVDEMPERIIGKDLVSHAWELARDLDGRSATSTAREHRGATNMK
jgi:hypothetical protein